MLRLRFLCIALFILAGCDTQNSFIDQYFNRANLPSQFFDIDITKDTVLHTAQGATIKIDKGSLKAEGNIVKLEIKEAYSISDMVLAGLITRAGDEPLSSGGMIYINPANKADVSIIKPIQARIPTGHLEEDMKLYKGQEDADGKIDWIEPTSLNPDSNISRLTTGEALFNTNCRSCHNPHKDATGPQLAAYLMQRRDWDWLKRFTRNSSQLIASGDRLANCLFSRWGKTVMTPFPELKDDELLALYQYLEKESEKYDRSSFPDDKKCLDSCELYEKLLLSANAKRSRLIMANGQLVEITNRGVTFKTDSEAARSLPPETVVPNYSQSEYYRVNINAFGWSNIDILTKNLPGFESSRLIVKVTGEYTQNFNLYLIIPSYKIYVEGGLLKDKEGVYGFYKNDGQIPLIRDVKAYILAVGEMDKKLLFSLTSFTTQKEQTLSVSLNETTREQMNAEIKKLSIPDMEINVGDSKNAAAIRNTNEEIIKLEKLKPKGCNCNCGMSRYVEGDSAAADVAEIF